MSSGRTSTTARPRCGPVAEKSGIIYFPYAFPKELYTKPASNAVLGMVASYQSGPAIYKYLKENKGVKTVAFVAANESDPLEPARQRRRRGQGARPRRGRRQGHLPERHARLHAGPDADRQAEARPARALGRRPGQRAAAHPLGARARLQGPDLDRDGAGRQGARGRRGRSRQRLHLGRRRLDAGNPLEGDGGVHRPLHQEVRRVQRRVEHQGLRAAIHRRHAEGRSEGDRRRRRIQEDDGRASPRRTPI